MNSKRWENAITGMFFLQLICLLIMGAAEFLNMTNGCIPQLPVALLMNGCIVLSLLGFWGITLWKAPRSVLQRDVILGMVMVAWFLILEMNRRLNYIPLQSLTVFSVVYLLALPFASITQDQDRQAGIRVVSWIYTGASLLFVLFGLILFAGGKLPGVLNAKVYWDGPRLFVLHHPNITSRMFIIGLALCMGFLGQTRKVWAKALLLLAAMLLFAAIALANCRAILLPSCGILAANVFFWIGTKNRKRICIAVVAAILVAGVSFWSSGWLYQWNHTRLINQAAQKTMQEQTVTDMTVSDYEVILPEETPLGETPEWKPQGNGNSSQPSLVESIPTLNGRTEIWTAFLQKILNDPAILLRGTVDSRLVLKVMHTHNAWLEALIMLGLPGLLLVLVFSWNATWASLRVLWFGSMGLFQKNIAMLALSMMVSGLLEPCLFITYQEWSFYDFFFFLCLGYLACWSKQLPRMYKK